MENWHLSRNVPIALFLGLVVQAVSVSGAFTKVEVGVEQNAKDITSLENTIDKLDTTAANHHFFPNDIILQHSLS